MNDSFPAPPPPSSPPPTQRKQPRLDFGLGLALVAGGLFTVIYRCLIVARLDRSVAMFVGVPMFLGTFAAGTNPRGAVGAAMKYVTLCLCVFAPLLGEGAVCLLMAAPIVYPVAALCAWGASRPAGGKLRAAAVVPFLAGLYARTPASELPKVEITDTLDVDGTPAEVWTAADHLVLPLAPPPLFLRGGFPTPIAVQGQGLSPGSERRIVFDNGTVVAHLTAADSGRRAAMTISYENVGPEFFDRWLLLDDSTFIFDPLPEGRTRITHTTHYRRLLAPGFYFGPLEEYGVHEMQRYLLDSFRDQIRARR
jgi:hypothetical protein